MHLLEGWRLIEGGHLLISFSDSAAVEAQKKIQIKWQKKAVFFVSLEGAPEGGPLFGGGRFLERGCLFKEILYS